MGLAVMCGLGAMFGAKKILARKGTSAVKTVEVVVAAKDVPVEQTLTDEMLTKKALPEDLVPAGAIIDPADARGRWARDRLLAGETILDGKLAARGAPTGLIGKITPGMRAVTIRVDEQSGISGFILPDYRVDVLRPETNHSSVSTASVLLQNVRVLASGTVIESTEDRSIKSDTVTLEVTPAQAEILTAAVHKGTLSLALRSLGDDAMLAPPTHPLPEPPTTEAAPAPTPVATLVELSDPLKHEALPTRILVFRGRRAVQLHRVGSATTGGTLTASQIGSRQPFDLDNSPEAGPELEPQTSDIIGEQ
jgi:pilus assembly protein CpaB